MGKYIFWFFILTAANVFAQGPNVPSVIDFAGMKLHLNDAARKQIQTDVDNLRRSESYFRKRVEKVDLHFPIIEKIFREENLPDDFKYLVIQESALVSDAISSSNAVGFWQFKKETALEMGLRVDNEVDERLNLASSSRAAARYLKKNNFYYDNWVYSLLAYNTGRGGAEKHIKDRDFGKKKMEINGNTHWYVKKFLAHKIAYEAEVGKTKGPYFLFEYNSGGGKSLKDISQEFEADYDLVQEYNKCFKRKRVPDDKNYCVIIPIGFDKTDLIASRNDDIYKKDPSEKNSGSSIFSINKSGSPVKKYYSQADQFPVVENDPENGSLYLINGEEGIISKPGDSFDMLALKGGISRDDFFKYNDLTAADKFKAGQVYYFSKKRNKAKTHYHTLMPGETLWEVSQKYGIKLKKLLAKNRLDDERQAKAGLVLWLRYIRPRSVPAEYHDIRHFQKQEVIAEKKEEKVTPPPPPVEETAPPKSYLVGDSKIQQNDDDLYFEEEPGDNSDTTSPVKATPEDKETGGANVRQDVVVVSEIKPTKTSVLTHEVQKGDTYFNISKRYDVDISDLLEWNNLKINDVLSLGQKLTIKMSATAAEPENNLRLSSVELPAPSQAITHTVTENDTLYGIAQKYQVTIKDIMEWNGKEDFVIKSGEELKIFPK